MSLFKFINLIISTAIIVFFLDMISLQLSISNKDAINENLGAIGILVVGVLVLSLAVTTIKSALQIDDKWNRFIVIFLQLITFPLGPAIYFFVHLKKKKTEKTGQI